MKTYVTSLFGSVVAVTLERDSGLGEIVLFSLPEAENTSLRLRGALSDAENNKTVFPELTDSVIVAINNSFVRFSVEEAKELKDAIDKTIAELTFF